MPILELPPNPTPTHDPATPQVKLRTGRYSGLEDHELIHLLDSIDDEVARARFRESIYKSIIICMAIAWFLFYGPRVLFHQPEYKDLISAMKEHDKQITYVEMPHSAPKPPPSRQLPDRKTLQQLQQQRPQRVAPTPPQTQAPTPPPQEQARTTAPPLPQAPTPQPSATRTPTPPLVDAPTPSNSRPQIAENTPSAHSAMQDAIQGGRGAQGRAEYGGSQYGSNHPLQAGAEILSDTQGVDFTAYMRRLHDDVQRNWNPLIPEEVQPPLLKKGIVGIRFTILPDGRIGAMTLETRSGDVALDRAAWSAITSEGNFPPLPTLFHGPQLELRVGFFYNTPITQ